MWCILIQFIYKKKKRWKAIMLIPKMKHYYNKYTTYKFAVDAVFQSCKWNGFLVPCSAILSFKRWLDCCVALALPVVSTSVIGEVCSGSYVKQNNYIFTYLINSLGKALSHGTPVPDVHICIAVQQQFWITIFCGCIKLPFSWWKIFMPTVGHYCPIISSVT